MADRSTKFSHSDSVRKNQEEEEIGEDSCVRVAIPDMQPFFLEGRDVCETRKKERIEVLRLPRTRDNATRKNITNFIAFVRSEVQDNPDVDPAVGLFVPKELCAVNRQHQDRVVVLDSTVLYGVKIVEPAQDVIPDEVVPVAIPQEILCFCSSIVHLLSHSRTLPTGLELRADGKRRKRLLTGGRPLFTQGVN